MCVCSNNIDIWHTQCISLHLLFFKCMYPVLSSQYDALAKSLLTPRKLAPAIVADRRRQVETDLAGLLLGDNIFSFRKRLFSIAKAAQIIEYGQLEESIHIVYHFLDDFIGPFLFEVIGRDQPHIHRVLKDLGTIRNALEKDLQNTKKSEADIAWFLSAKQNRESIKRAFDICSKYLAVFERWQRNMPFPDRDKMQSFIEAIMLKEQFNLSNAPAINKQKVALWAMRMIKLRQKNATEEMYHKHTCMFMTDEHSIQEAQETLLRFLSSNHNDINAHFDIIKQSVRADINVLANVRSIVDSFEGLFSTNKLARERIQSFLRFEDSQRIPLTFEEEFRLLEHKEELIQEKKSTPWIGVEKYTCPMDGKVFERFIPYFLEQLIDWEFMRTSNDVEDILEGIDMFFYLPQKYDQSNNEGFQFGVDVYLNGGFEELMRNPVYQKKCGKARMLSVMSGTPRLVVALPKASIWYDLVVFMLQLIAKDPSQETSKERYREIANEVLSCVRADPELSSVLNRAKIELHRILRRQVLQAQSMLINERLATKPASATMPNVDALPSTDTTPA